MINTDKNKVLDLLNNAVSEVTIKKKLEEKLLSGKKLKIKFGIDPTGSDLHLGHAVPLKKLADFQKMGHHIIFLFGSFTAKIGDPTGKSKLRKPLTKEVIDQNMETYLKQASKIIDINNIEVVKNSDWLGSMNFDDVLKLAGSFTVSQMLQRDMFQARLKDKKDINLVEFFYPLMQGYDSVALKSDVEIGGTEQLFNLMAGRKIQEYFEMIPQNIMTVHILEGLDGKEKMSKSLNNYISLMDTPKDVFGKTMSIPDSLIKKYYELLTDYSTEEINKILDLHPRDSKIKLAWTLTKLLHNEDEANFVKDEFIKIFSSKDKGGIPIDIETIKLESKEYNIWDLAIKSGLFSSNSEAKRKILEGAFKVNNIKKNDIEELFFIKNSKEYILQFGKRRFIKVLGG
jgi:tyrosyl-tRNA synthetase